MVKYGNYEIWSEEVQVDGTIMCNNDQSWNDPVNGVKFCWCTPQNPTSTVRSTRNAMLVEDASAVIPEGYSKTSCMVGEITSQLPAFAVMMLPGKTLEGAVATAVPMTVDSVFGTTGSRIRLWNQSTMTSTITIPVVNFQLMQSLREDPSPLKDEAVKAAAPFAATPNTAQIAAVAPLVEWQLDTLPAVDVTTSGDAVAQTPSTAAHTAAVGAPTVAPTAAAGSSTMIPTTTELLPCCLAEASWAVSKAGVEVAFAAVAAIAMCSCY